MGVGGAAWRHGLLAVGAGTLSAINAGELTCSPVSRHRLEGAVMALEALSARPQTSISGQPAE